MRQIVIDAFKCDELVYQFTRIDVEDGILKTGDAEEVNEKYSDEYIIGEAENRKSISGSWIPMHKPLEDFTDEERMHLREYGQLLTFLHEYKYVEAK